ncbi:MAG: hypothetical protein HY300_13225, partial [Verrucomicrobia bacterium]|nr:hypothetical protein [Verrucomicrobiota bacterium]
ANALAVLRAVRGLGGVVRLVSFDRTLAALQFALKHKTELGYLDGYEAAAGSLIESHSAEFKQGLQRVHWELHLADFPSFLAPATRGSAPPRPPQAILFDPHSPAVNPAMWTVSVFAAIHARLDPSRLCALATYSRATLVRVALLLAGFFVGKGGVLAEKEETTVAANSMTLLDAPLDRRWLERARRSDAAEPLCDAVYRRAPLRDETWARLQAHPQFQG